MELITKKETRAMKSNSKVRFNAVDLIIVLVIIAVAAVGIYILMPKGASGSETSGEKNVKAIVQIEFANKDEYLTTLPQVGDSVTIGVKEKMPATVTKVESVPAEKVSYDLVSGSASIQTIPGKYDVYVTMEADAVDTKDAIKINGSAIRIGDSDAVHSRGWAGHGFVTRLDITE